MAAVLLAMLRPRVHIQKRMCDSVQPEGNNDILRAGLTVNGQVQGVGFRPFVWRLASEEGLSGFCQNTSAGVRIEVQGSAGAVARFEQRLTSELPPLARITGLQRESLPSVPAESGFAIRESSGHAGQNVLVSPDVAICADCVADIRSPENPRFRYPFTNCTNCGPRYSITARIPYDRQFTSMACFSLCANCAAEYTDPANRRFHAQPVACSRCGPRLWFVDQNDLAKGETAPDSKNTADAIAKTCSALQKGQIIAIRGLGGFQLACDARNPAAVAELRRRKQRPHKALAVMAPDLEVCREICEIGKNEADLLSGQKKPIVLCRHRPGLRLADWIAPDCDTIGLMLPYTPLHALLLDCLKGTTPLLVMTSANPRGEPICLGNREALARLKNLADAWLLHDRDILCRVDDSVVAVPDGAPVFLRRARGYVPEPVALASAGPCCMGAGAELKTTFCLARGTQAFTSQHIGDMESPASLEFYEQTLSHLENLLEVRPELIVHDLHPDFLSTRLAKTLAAELAVPAIPLQHHAAHAASCLAENMIHSPALALCLDGSGLGSDGTVWGGELLLMDLSKPEWQRLGHLSPFPLPGGEAAIRSPWRISAGLQWQNGSCPASARPVVEMLERGLNSPLTTSCGRLFDAVSAQLGICREITYEGQAAIRLEKVATAWLEQHSASSLPVWDDIFEPELMQISSNRIFARIMGANEPGFAAAAFHCNLAAGLARMTLAAAERLGIRKIALTGGACQNRLLTGLLTRHLTEYGMEPLVQRLLPPGDGGLSFGQAVWGRQLCSAGKFSPWLPVFLNLLPDQNRV